MNSRSPRLTGAFFLSLVLVLSQAAFGATRIVSDLDDTIKVTHSNHEEQSTLRALFRREAFTGAPLLYRSLQAKAAADGLSGTSLTLLSASPKEIGFAVQEFATLHGLTRATEIILAGSDERDTLAYKKAKVKALLETDLDSRFIFIGDDTQHDPDVYLWAEETFPGRSEGVFIRRVSPKQDEDRIAEWEARGVFYFQTTLELALELARRDLLPVADLEAVARATLEQDEQNLLLPYYMGDSLFLFRSASECAARIQGIPSPVATRARILGLCEGLKFRLIAEAVANAAFERTWKDTPVQLVSLMNPEGDRILSGLIDHDTTDPKMKAAAWVIRGLLRNYNWLREKKAPEALQAVPAKAILKILAALR